MRLQSLNNINKYNVLILCIICLGILFPQAYSISGKVIDSKTKNPINNVNVYIENSTVGTITDKDGLFILNVNNQLNSNVHLIIKMIGYKEEHLQFKLFTKSKINLGNIFLTSKSLELESIHIHSHKSKSNQISNISLSGQTLNENLVGNIATTLSNQPNIGVNSYGTVTSKPVLRGYSGDRFLLTKDGNKTGDLSQSSIDHVITLDMMEVNEIEIIRGPKSLIYGSNAIGGVINTSISGNPKVRVDKLYKKLFLGGESFNDGLYGNMRLYIPRNNNQINMLLSIRNTGNQTSSIGELKNTYSQTYNNKLGFTKYNKDGYLNFMIENFNMDYGIPPSEEGHISGVDIALFKNTFQINYHQDILFDLFNQFDVNYNFINYNHDEFVNNSASSSVGLSKNTHNLKTEFTSSHTVIGSELNYKQFLPNGLYFTPETDELDLSVYAFHQTHLKDFDLLSSFRIGHLLVEPKPGSVNFNNLNSEEIINRSYNYFSSSIGIKKVIEKFEMNSWIMNTMKAPIIEELYSDGPHLGSYSYEIGSPNLKLEKIHGIESSLSYNAIPLSFSIITFYNYSPYYYQMTKMGECNISGWNEIDDHPCAGVLNQNDEGEEFIEWGSGPVGWLYKYKTEGVESLIKGLEFNLSYHYHNFKLVYDFSLVRGDNLTEDRPLSYINPDKQILILDYKKKAMNYKLRFSKIHSQDRLGEFETYTPSSQLVDLIFAYNNEKQNITVQFNNLFNEEYYNHLSKIKSIMPEAGRNIVFSYKIFF